MPDRTALRAGPLELAVTPEGDLRRISVGGQEVLRRIYVAIRDRNWGTIPARIENLKISQQGSHFSITYDSIHQQGDIDFRWRATIMGTDAGKITFAMDGKAHSTFLRNRIGFCVRHPLKGCAGRPCTIEKTGGSRERGVFPDLVSPHQPFIDVVAIAHEPAPGIEAEVRFHGEVFEMEDHRNWTDANYKTYGTPLRLPFPVEIKAGTEIHQMVELTVRGRAAAGVRSTGEVLIRRTESASKKLPALGLGWRSGGSPELLKRLRLNHVRVDSPDDLDAARALGVKLEAAFAPVATVAVDRWLRFENYEAARKLLGPEAFIAAGTDANFAELNRNRPQGEAWNALTFSINPQVHAFDDESVMENAAGQFDAVRTAKTFSNGKPVIVSPVTLRQRFNPVATSAAEPPQPDPRQTEQFCAAWTVASLKYLAEAGAHSVTYFETNGPGGVMNGDKPYPVYRIFEALADFAGGDVIPTESSDPFRAVALEVRIAEKRRILIANLTDVPQKVRIEDRVVELKPYEVL
jgi:D-apionolactonase